MTIKPFVLFLGMLAVIVRFAPFAFAQELDGSDVRRELRERAAKFSKLSTEDQLRVRAAEQKSAEDPVVQAALAKRNQAIQEFRAAVRASMIKADPKVEPILDKVTIPAKGR